MNKYELLVVARPDSAFPSRDRYVIDQFIMNGGRVLWLLDAMNAHLDSLRRNQFSIATPKELGIDELLFSYGVRINKDLIVDKSCAPIEIFTQPYGNQRKLERFPWYFEPVLIPESTHPVVSNIDPVHTRFVSSIDTIAMENVDARMAALCGRATELRMNGCMRFLYGAAASRPSMQLR